MTVTINGKNMTLPDTASLQEAIAQVCPHQQRIIAEVDGRIIDRTVWATTPLNPGSKVELITFVGGG